MRVLRAQHFVESRMPMCVCASVCMCICVCNVGALLLATELSQPEELEQEHKSTDIPLELAEVSVGFLLPWLGTPWFQIVTADPQPNREHDFVLTRTERLV